MATATKPRQAAKGKAEVTGSVTCETLANGKYIVIGTQTYKGGSQRHGALASAQAWQESTPNSRVVEHYFDHDNKQRHPVRFESGRTGDGKPADGGWEFDTCADPYHYQGADYTAPALQ